MKVGARGLVEAYLAVFLVMMVGGAVAMGGTRGRNLAIAAGIAAVALVASRIAARRGGDGETGGRRGPSRPQR